MSAVERGILDVENNKLWFIRGRKNEVQTQKREKNDLSKKKNVQILKQYLSHVKCLKMNVQHWRLQLRSMWEWQMCENFFGSISYANR